MSDAASLLLQALRADPGDETAWLVFADALEENGQAERAERTRRMLRLLEWPRRSNSLGMSFALIPPGVFHMGSPKEEEGHSAEEGPVHEVEITQPFYLGVYQVTQAQWRAVMGANPSYFCPRGGGGTRVTGMNTDDFPVEQVSWEDAVEFLDRVSTLKQEQQAGRKYRLPTEAEWEYACRGGPVSYRVFHFGNSLSSLQANFDGNHPYGGAAKGPYLDRTSKVGGGGNNPSYFSSYKPNAFGLFDMHGNVWEWCSDWYGGDYYADSPPRDPQGPAVGTTKVLRGGSWYSLAHACRSARRSSYPPGVRYGRLGFRVVAVPVAE